jgi:hypothetical protein
MRIQHEFSVTPGRSKGIDFVSFHDFLLLDVRTFPTMWYFYRCFQLLKNINLN